MIYFILFIYEMFICYFYDAKQLNEKRMFQIHEYKLRISVQKGIVSLAIIIPLWFVMGLRYNIGSDYRAYENIFQLARRYNTNNYRMELGYYYLNRAAGYISENPQIIFFLTAFLIVFFLFKGIEKNNGSMYYGVLGYIGLGYYFYAMNIQRQYVAIMIMLYAFYFLEKKKLWEYIICVAIAASFHMSAIIWLPVYFAINYMPTKIFYIGSLTSALLFNRFSNYLLNVLAIIGFYTVQITRNKSFFREHISVSNIVLLGTFLICGVIFRKQLQISNEKIDLKYKAVWLAFLIYTFFYLLGSAATRIAVYLSPVSLLIISDIISCFDIHTRKWIRVFVTVVLMVLMVIVVTYTGNRSHTYLPYNYRLL